MKEGTGTRLRRAAASAEITARLTAAMLGEHIRSLPEGVRHHYESSAPLPPEAEEAKGCHEYANTKGKGSTPVGPLGKLMGFLRSLFGGLTLATLYLCSGGKGEGAVSLCGYAVEPTEIMRPTEGVVVVVSVHDGMATTAVDGLQPGGSL